jgi:hypothetical protein
MDLLNQKELDLYTIKSEGTLIRKYLEQNDSAIQIASSVGVWQCCSVGRS